MELTVEEMRDSKYAMPPAWVELERQRRREERSRARQDNKKQVPGEVPEACAHSISSDLPASIAL
jgi:hypothetical protein